MPSMSSNNKQHINLQLDAHRVALDVDMDKEEYYRKAAVLLNERHKYYLNRYRNAPADLLWVYVALETGVRLCNLEQIKSTEPLLKQAAQMNSEIEKVLAEPNLTEKEK